MLARVDDSGEILWTRRFDHGFGYEIAVAVLDNGDGTWAVISQGDRSVLCLSQYDVDGNERSFRKIDVGMFVRGAARLGDGYIVQVLGADLRGTAVLLKLDREGNVQDRFVYEGEDCDYYLLDMAEYGGQVYLSAYACPKQTDEGGRHEIGNILDYVFHQKEWNISSEELTPLVRENYTAVLLVCDPVGGTPRTFYSVKGSLGGTLNVNGAGELEWDVDRITSTFFSPSTSSFTVGGTCSVFRYAFGPSGELLRQTDTGETVPYRR